MKYHIPKNEYPIEYLYVVLSRDNDGNEGIVSHISDRGGFPLVSGKEEYTKIFRELAKQMSKETGKKLYIMKYKKVEQLEIIE